MDAVKFIEERNRMCDSHVGSCEGCPLYTEPCLGLRTVDLERMVGVVEEWSAAHPRKTRQSVLLEQWPNCMIDNNGVVGICPRNVDNKCICDLEHSYVFHGCPACRREFWMQGVE